MTVKEKNGKKIKKKYTQKQKIQQKIQRKIEFCLNTRFHVIRSIMFLIV